MTGASPNRMCHQTLLPPVQIPEDVSNATAQNCTCLRLGMWGNWPFHMLPVSHAETAQPCCLCLTHSECCLPSVLSVCVYCVLSCCLMPCQPQDHTSLIFIQGPHTLARRVCVPERQTLTTQATYAWITIQAARCCGDMCTPGFQPMRRMVGVLTQPVDDRSASCTALRQASPL